MIRPPRHSPEPVPRKWRVTELGGFTPRQLQKRFNFAPDGRVYYREPHSKMKVGDEAGSPLYGNGWQIKFNKSLHRRARMRFLVEHGWVPFGLYVVSHDDFDVFNDAADNLIALRKSVVAARWYAWHRACD